MARAIGKLAPNAANKVTKPGRYADGGGLYLVVSRSGTKSWAFRYMHGSTKQDRKGKAHELGLGPAHAFSLSEARERARKVRQQLADGVDPLATKREAKRQVRQAQTFAEVAELCITSKAAGWSDTTTRSWRNSLRDHAMPVIGELAVDRIGLGDIMHVLEPIWRTKTETARKVMERIESILDYAETRGWRDGKNPARWKGHLENLLPDPSDVAPVKSHPAMDWRQVPAFMAELAKRDSASAKALRLLILTATRSNECRAARWGEFDLAGRVWTIPSERMKAGKDHRVPLTDDSLDVLGQPGDPGDVVFSAMNGKPLSDVALSKLVPAGCTVHGFRSSFRDWAGETTAHPREVIELAMAHRQGDKVEQAYARGDLFRRRQRLMQDWSNYCLGRPVVAGTVVEMRAAG